jgi:hypothetical protein
VARMAETAASGGCRPPPRTAVLAPRHNRKTRRKRSLSNSGGPTAEVPRADPESHPLQNQFTLQRRKENKSSIEYLAYAIRERMKAYGHHAHEAAWGRAVEQWLVENGVLTVRQSQTVLPHFP